jgi:hypothetical protein
LTAGVEQAGLLDMGKPTSSRFPKRRFQAARGRRDDGDGIGRRGLPWSRNLVIALGQSDGGRQVRRSKNEAETLPATSDWVRVVAVNCCSRG